MKKIISIFIALLVLSGCSNAEQTQTDTINIVTTYYPYQLMTEEIGGEHVSVSSIYPADSDAHSYELTPSQTIDIQDADILIITNQNEDNKVYSSLPNTDNLLILNDDEESETTHAWLSPSQASQAVTTITDSLIDFDPTNELYYQETSSNLLSELETVSDNYKTFGQTQTKPIIATHDAYSSLTTDYNIQFVTLYGKHHDDEPTTKEIIDTVDLINEKDINTIFVEQDDTANSIIHQIADETNSSIETIFTLETESSVKSFDSIIDFYNYNLEMMEKGQE